MWWDVALDALLDTLKLLPFLLLLYILIELMEHNTRMGKPNRAFTGRLAPLAGAAAGLVPMCGFSVMAAKLYGRRHITVGTLIAVFIATSDEAVLVLLLGSLGWTEKLLTLAALLGCKFVLAFLLGFAIDAILHERRRLAPMPFAPIHMHAEHEHRQDEHDHEHDHDHEEEHHGEDHAHGECACAELQVCEHGKENPLTLYLFSPLLHALKVAGFVFLVNLLFGTLIFLVGEDKVAAFLEGAGYWWQPLLCALVGAIPNCAASVVLAEVYSLGGIGFGGLLAGLTVDAGLGYLILLHRDTWKKGLAILGGIVLLGLVFGYAACALQLVI